MKILIAGSPKTGTTALLYLVRRSIGGEVREMFEPRRYDPEPGDASIHVVAKVLISPLIPLELASFSSFDKKIGIVRDARDQLISRMLYSVFDSDYFADDAATGRLVRLLEKKEQRPDSVSVLDILRLMQSLANEARQEKPAADGSLDAQIAEQYTQWAESMMGIFRGAGDFYMVRYEDYVAGDTAGLEQHLGFPLKRSDKVDAKYSRVVRTKGAGDWRNWFTPQDVSFFRPILSKYAEQFGYGDDWELAASPSISAANGSFYVRSLIAERRVKALLKDDARAREVLACADELLLAFRTDLGPRLAAAGCADSLLDGLLFQLQYVARRLSGARRKGNLFDEIADAKARLAAERAKLQRTREERDRTLNSLSWKITKPLRWFGR